MALDGGRPFRGSSHRSDLHPVFAKRFFNYEFELVRLAPLHWRRQLGFVVARAEQIHYPRKASPTRVKWITRSVCGSRVTRRTRCLHGMFPIRDSIPSRSTPVATRLIVLVNVVVFVFELTLSPESLQQVVYLFGIVPARFTHPEWAASVGLPIGAHWPLLTHQFLHGGWLHIISNMWALWIFGDNVEDRMGSIRFLIFYLVCGTVAGIAHVYINADSVVPSVGASGAIAGVLGAYLLFFPTARLLILFPIFIFPFFFEVPAVLYLVIWFLTQLFSGTANLTGSRSVADIAWWAHIGGFGCGMVLCRVFASRKSRGVEVDEAETEPILQMR